MPQRIQQIIASIGVIALGMFLFAQVSTSNSNEVQETRSSFIVQADSLDKAFRAVQGLDAEITHKLQIINAVGANLTPSQVEALRATEGIRVLETAE